MTSNGTARKGDGGHGGASRAPSLARSPAPGGPRGAQACLSAHNARPITEGLPLPLPPSHLAPVGWQRGLRIWPHIARPDVVLGWIFETRPSVELVVKLASRSRAATSVKRILLLSFRQAAASAAPPRSGTFPALHNTEQGSPISRRGCLTPSRRSYTTHFPSAVCCPETTTTPRGHDKEQQELARINAIGQNHKRQSKTP